MRGTCAATRMAETPTLVTWRWPFSTLPVRVLSVLTSVPVAVMPAVPSNTMW